MARKPPAIPGEAWQAPGLFHQIFRASSGYKTRPALRQMRKEACRLVETSGGFLQMDVRAQYQAFVHFAVTGGAAFEALARSP